MYDMRLIITVGRVFLKFSCGILAVSYPHYIMSAALIPLSFDCTGPILQHCICNVCHAVVRDVLYLSSMIKNETPLCTSARVHVYCSIHGSLLQLHHPFCVCVY